MATATAVPRTRRPVSRQVVAAALFGAGVVAASVLGSVATTGTTDSAWFAELEKPAWYPPSWMFGVVWTVLYVMIAVAGWLAWRHGASARALTAWGVQIALNLGWSVIFFGLRLPGWALAEIVVLAAAVAWTMVELRRVDRRAGVLFLPYLAWVGFALSLNAGIVVLN